MKLNNSNWLTISVSIIGVASVGFLIGLPSRANEALNPDSSMVTKTINNSSQTLLVSSQSSEAVSIKKNPQLQTQQIAQQNSGSGSRSLNPSPSIFNEPPYNRSRTTPGETTPTIPGTEKPLPSPSSGRGSKDVVALVQSNGQLKKLTQALKSAGLVETLKGKGPFTVFAPTDAAFGELPQDAVAELFKPENKEVLVKILTYHVVPGQVLSSDLKSGEVKSVEGAPISVKVDGKNGVMVNDATVTQADLKASNGVVHIINKVILPPNL